jgi:DNA polymerase-3 subunit alpha
MMWEKELLGLYVTSHPFAEFQKLLSHQLTMVKDVSGQPRNKWVVVGGVIDSTKKKITRAGKPMMFVTIQDTTSSLELLVFPKTYETTKEVWIEGKMACVIGKTSEDEGDDKLFVEKAYELTSENVHDLAQQLSIGSSVSAKNTSPQEDYSMLPVHEDIHPPLLVLVDAVEIIVSPQVMKDKAEELKMLFGNYPGNKTVFLKVGEKKIKTSFSVDGSEEFQKEILGVL